MGEIDFYASAANATNVVTEFLIQPLAGPNRKPRYGAYETLGYLRMAAESVATFSVPAGYYAAAYRFVDELTGQMTDLQPLAVCGVTLSVAKGGADEAPRASRRKAA